ncbi:MAG: hypothetical protein WC836_11390, partial [Desulfobacula sp.]
MLVFTCTFIFGNESGLMMKTIKTKKFGMAFANEKTPEMRIPDWDFQSEQKKTKRSSFLAEREEGSCEYSQENPRIKKPTPEQYLAYQQAFDYFSRKLFESSLPGCMLSYGK